MNSRNELTLLDAITIVSFIIGLANYEENISQTDVQNVVKAAVDDIHVHLSKQDEIIEKLSILLDKKAGESNA